MALMACASLAARTLRAVGISGVLFFVALQCGAAPTMPVAQAVPATTIPARTTAAPPPSKSDVRPLWNELTPDQQHLLEPLAPEWNKLDANHKAKWIAISNKFPSMSPEKQLRLQENIRDWAKLTPEQHRIARESYARAKKLDADQKAAQWQQYQQLPEEQKRKLAADAAAKKRIVNLPSAQNKTKIVEPLKAANKPASPPPHPVTATAPGTTVPVARTSPVVQPVPSVLFVPASSTPPPALPTNNK